jgi:predicted SprT family Zn-dependent metalloprotease
MRWYDKSKYSGQCKCGHQWKVGDRILQVETRNSRRSLYLCQKCGEQFESEQAAADFDERQYASQYSYFA